MRKARQRSSVIVFILSTSKKILLQQEKIFTFNFDSLVVTKYGIFIQ